MYICIHSTLFDAALQVSKKFQSTAYVRRSEQIGEEKKLLTKNVTCSV